MQPYIRTPKAKEINKKLEGLKNFFKDFTKINEREYKELSIWNEYLIYSVIFNQNQNIIEDVLSKLK